MKKSTILLALAVAILAGLSIYGAFCCFGPDSKGNSSIAENKKSTPTTGKPTSDKSPSPNGSGSNNQPQPPKKPEDPPSPPNPLADDEKGKPKDPISPPEVVNNSNKVNHENHVSTTNASNEDKDSVNQFPALPTSTLPKSSGDLQAQGASTPPSDSNLKDSHAVDTPQVNGDNHPISNPNNEDGQMEELPSEATLGTDEKMEDSKTLLKDERNTLKDPDGGKNLSDGIEALVLSDDAGSLPDTSSKSIPSTPLTAETNTNVAANSPGTPSLTPATDTNVAANSPGTPPSADTIPEQKHDLNASTLEGENGVHPPEGHKGPKVETPMDETAVTEPLKGPPLRKLSRDETSVDSDQTSASNEEASSTKPKIPEGRKSDGED